jgi:hypothetical protein
VHYEDYRWHGPGGVTHVPRVGAKLGESTGEGLGGFPLIGRFESHCEITTFSLCLTVDQVASKAVAERSDDLYVLFVHDRIDGVGPEETRMQLRQGAKGRQTGAS